MTPTPRVPDLPSDSFVPWPEDATRLLGRLRRLIDEDGVPRVGGVDAWWGWLATIQPKTLGDPGSWPEGLDIRLRGLLLAALRFSRPDGSAVFAEEGEPDGRAAVARRWAETLRDEGIAQVARWWFGRRGAKGPGGPPPLPAFGRDGIALAMLRADWRSDGDLIAIDHRHSGSATNLEVRSGGTTLLGPRWSAEVEATGRVRRIEHASGPLADWVEWTMPTGEGRVVRTAVLLRGRGLALLADEWHGGGETRTMEVATAVGLSVSPIVESRALAMKYPGGAAKILPLGMPSLPYPTDRGSLAWEPERLILTTRFEAKRSWMPLLLCWDKARGRRTATWRGLTVSERSKVCPPGTAFAARVAWGPGDGLVVYRSLARPALRSFLGHQTTARFLIGTFDAEGNVKPLLKIE